MQRMVGMAVAVFAVAGCEPRDCTLVTTDPPQPLLSNAVTVAPVEDGHLLAARTCKQADCDATTLARLDRFGAYSEIDLGLVPEQWPPLAILASGERYLLHRFFEGGADQTEFVLLDRSLAIVEQARFDVGDLQPQVIAVPDGYWLNAFGGEGMLAIHLLDASGAITPLATIQAGRRPSIARIGSTMWLFYTSDAGVVGQRIGLDGTVLDATPIVFQAGRTFEHAAATGNRALLVTSNGAQFPESVDLAIVNEGGTATGFTSLAVDPGFITPFRDRGFLIHDHAGTASTWVDLSGQPAGTFAPAPTLPDETSRTTSITDRLEAMIVTTARGDDVHRALMTAPLGFAGAHTAPREHVGHSYQINTTSVGCD